MGPSDTSTSDSEIIYLDNAATTPVRAEVAEAMGRTLVEVVGNPSSRHGLGAAAQERLESARRVVASRLGVAPGRVTFTSGGTEANGMALLGTCRRGGRGGHALVSAVEHPSVLGSAKLAAREGLRVELLPVDASGTVTPGAVAERLRPDTRLVAVMRVNNETGVVQPVEEIAALVRRRVPRCRLLVDAVQALGTLISTDPDRFGAHLLTVSAHKVHGPRGVGCLVRAPGTPLAPLWGGGDQEGGARPGTENLAGAVGLARALELLDADEDRLRGYIETVADAFRARFPGARILGEDRPRAPHIAALGVPDTPAEIVMNLLESHGIIVSTGAACHSRRALRSHVLEAMNVPPSLGVIRVSVSALTTGDEVDRAARIVRGLPAL